VPNSPWEALVSLHTLLNRRRLNDTLVLSGCIAVVGGLLSLALIRRKDFAQAH
jgi:hypothetical protein